MSPGHIAVAIELEAPQGGTGNVQPGDNVAVFGTYQNVQIITGDLRQLVNNPGTSPTAGQKQDVPDFTVTLIRSVQVLKIENPAVDDETGEQSDSDRIRVTLDLLPQDAQNLVFAQENGLVWLGLLNPEDEDGLETDCLDRAAGASDRSETGMTDASVVAVGTPQSFRQQLARAIEMGPDEVGWVQSATAAEELLINAFQPIDVLVLSPEVKEPDALGLAEFVGRQAPGTAMVLVRDHTWNGLLPAAMRAGIRDVVDMTQGTEELRDAVERAIVWASNLRSVNVSTQVDGQPVTRGRILSVFSSKGGTGKTFLTSNLATAISEVTGQDTAVVDLDIDMGDVFTYFGREPSATIQDLMELGEGAERSRIKQIGVQLSEHLWGFGAPPDPAAEAPAGEAIGKFLRALRNEFSWVVVDASVDYSDSALVCFDLSDAICLVTGLDVVGVKHLSKSLDTLLTIGLPRERFRVVLNRADSKVGLDASDVERVMKINVDAMIPSSRLVPTSLNKGRPVVLDEPNSEVAQAVRQLAVRFAGQAEMVAAGEAGIDTKKKRKLFARS